MYVCVCVLRNVPGIRCCRSKTTHTELGGRRRYSGRCIWVVVVVVVVVVVLVVLVVIMDVGRGGRRR